MRMLVVTAHYPPNFVSGGTLQPQRLARGMRARGHEVAVFAGWIGARPDLETWDEVDETGLPVRWVVSAPWIGWGDERNWWNPEVTEVFRAHVEALAPDVVHFHSLQSLGAGLLPVARAAGARVVVTMHDFWWLCTRQFLVDPDLHPCSLVVDAGVCPCEVDEAWRERRGESLRALLGSADLVLAPSASAARVLAANGLAEGRLEVDENGLPVEVLERLASGDGAASRPAGEPVRFLYAGGPEPVKGIGVVLDAVARLASDPPWSLTAHGAAPFLERTGRVVDPARVDVRDPFAPDELGAVLRAHDVLVLPSIMRETHSLLTREALAAGLPVVCTDTLGPEEVVEHGRNGLVVPAGDAVALAAAMRRLVEEPELLAGLRDRVREVPVRVRPLDDQVHALEDRLSHLAPAARPGPGPVRRVLYVVGIDGAPLRYRAHLPAEALRLRGVEAEVRHYRDPDLLAAGGRADVVVAYRVPATVQVLEVLGALRAVGTPVVFDVDDLIFDPAIRDEIPALRLLPDDEARLWMEGVRRYRTTMEACDAYLGSTEMLVRHAEEVTGLPAHRLDNGVGLVLARLSDAEVRRPRAPGPTRLGYLSGTTSHDEDWFFVEPAVVEVLERRPEVELWLGGHLPESRALDRFGPRVRRLPFVPWTELPAILRDLDVNLAPLAPDSRFNEAKSAIKWLEAALCATPTVASPTGPFREAVEPGVTGLLAADPDEWVDALLGLVDHPDEQARLGGLARRRALLEWSPWLQGRRLLDVLEQVVARGPLTGRTSTWEPVANDEPSLVVPLEPYGVAGPAVPPASTPTPPEADGAPPRPSLRRLREAVARDGWSVTARRVWSMGVVGARRAAARLRGAVRGAR